MNEISKDWDLKIIDISNYSYENYLFYGKGFGVFCYGGDGMVFF